MLSAVNAASSGSWGRSGRVRERAAGLARPGSGDGPQPAGATTGRMMENLRAAGIDPARVTHVVISHFHGDHVSGLLGDYVFRSGQNEENVTDPGVKRSV